MNDLPMLSVWDYSKNSNGEQLGTIKWFNGRLVGSTPGIQAIADSCVMKSSGSPMLAYNNLNGWSNGYLWVKPVK